MAQSASERRAAQRRTARIVRANRERPREQQIRIIDIGVRRAVFQARMDYANRVLNGQEPMPQPGTAEANNLASLASYGAHGQADPQFEAAFNRYWYHFKNAQNEADIEDTADYEEEE
jgi:hypothetical protein